MFIVKDIKKKLVQKTYNIIGNRESGTKLFSLEKLSQEIAAILAVHSVLEGKTKVNNTFVLPSIFIKKQVLFMNSNKRGDQKKTLQK